MAISLKQNIKELLLGVNTDRSFSMSLGVLYKGREVFKSSFGKPYKYYDFASMTKAMFLGSYFYERPEMLEMKVSTVLPWLYKSKIKVKDLLNHSSGFRGHLELFKDLSRFPMDERKTELKRVLRAEAVRASKKQKKSVEYSDLGFLLLGLLVEEFEGMSLEDLFEQESKIDGVHYSLENRPKYKKSLYAPTAKSKWRKKTIQGEVFDDNAYVLGGVAPQAGLFGTVNDMLSFGKTVRGMYNKAPEYFKKKNREFANGFMVPSNGDKTTAGKYFSKKSVGHLGFTGTSFWYDPEADLFVVVLANRTFPNRNDFSFNKIRPEIHNIVYEKFVK